MNLYFGSDYPVTVDTDVNDVFFLEPSARIGTVTRADIKVVLIENGPGVVEEPERRFNKNQVNDDSRHDESYPVYTINFLLQQSKRSNSIKDDQPSEKKLTDISYMIP